MGELSLLMRDLREEKSFLQRGDTACLLKARHADPSNKTTHVHHHWIYILSSMTDFIADELAQD